MRGVMTWVVQAVLLLASGTLALQHRPALSLGIVPANFGQNTVKLAACNRRRGAFSVRCARALETAEKRTARRCE